MYLAEIEHVMRQAVDDRETAKDALKRSDEWRKAEESLRGTFCEEVKRLTAAPAAAKPK